jgi:hypothetical protein
MGYNHFFKNTKAFTRIMSFLTKFNKLFFQRFLIVILAALITACGSGTSESTFLITNSNETTPSIETTESDEITSSLETDESDDTISSFVTNESNKIKLEWTPPSYNEDGSELTDLGGYIIYYGSSDNQLNNTIILNDPDITSYMIDNLDTDIEYYFAISAYNNNGYESERSDILNLIL